jgi:uncharacterized Rossmann fold enzyme
VPQRHYKARFRAVERAVEYSAWAPFYREIAAEFGFAPEKEEAARRRLLELLPDAARRDPLGRIARRIAGRDVIVVGLSSGLGPPPLHAWPRSERPPVLVAADGATEVLVGAGLVPELVTTDLDGPVPVEIVANQRGSLVVVHGHGDNLDALARWVPDFPGELAGSWAGPPDPGGLIDVGGFTDGDRAVFLAEHVGARRIRLFGFDFERPREAAEPRRGRQRAKLRWARRVLLELARRTATPLEVWRPDGSAFPLAQLGGDAAVSTQ